MNNTIQETIRNLSVQLAPDPTGAEPKLLKIEGIRAVLFDIYGTLFISGSGDVGTAAAASKGAAFREALATVNLDCPIDEDAAVAVLIEQIKRRQAEIRESGTEYPEIEIVGVWARTLAALELLELPQPDVERLAIDYESRVNPVWPMPNCREVLDSLREQGLALGIISNAQFFTLELFPALLDVSRAELGFDPALEFFSYRFESAKPGTDLYERAAAALAERDIQPQEVLYVGNDMLNDITPAAAVGFRTVLFAGDARSLRLREDDERVRNVTPDAIVTNLDQIPGMIPV
ncbi:HAD family hydrolase [Calycomorphotria hydatis]|uniref:Phosphoglycolate phosphatase n=1 Tax=Calycomorphotria hydatis TaxID=2528027 RepID=A0A517T4R5_9PLAN|nr:HAD family hydrolase [Calycomorphotria hydatis]QDT63359.1 Phosphoglycolate phosphatase [Calycomorphotria hydatis]